jgi:Immunoglobulin domain
MGEAISREARMSIRRGSENEPTRPQFVQIPAGHVFFDEDSDFIIMHCVASGVPKPNIAWTFNDQPLRDNVEHIEIHDNGTLVIHSPIEEDEGSYKCEATNYLGSISTVANYKINGETMIELFEAETRLIFLSSSKKQTFSHKKQTFVFFFLIVCFLFFFLFFLSFPLK